MHAPLKEYVSQKKRTGHLKTKLGETTRTRTRARRTTTTTRETLKIIDRLNSIILIKEVDTNRIGEV